MKKRLLLTWFVLLGLASAAWAQETVTYALKVKGKDVTSENRTDVLHDGTVSFDGNKTLTLRNAYIWVDDGSGIYNEIPDLEVVVVGSNTIESKQGTAFFAANNVHFKGSGTLRLKGYDCGLYCAFATKKVSVSGGVHLICEGGERATAENPYSGGLSGGSNKFGVCRTTLEVSGARTQLEAKGIGAAYSMCYLSRLVLNDGLEITYPAGAAFDLKKNAVCDADGNIIAGKWVMIKSYAKTGDVNGDGTVDVADISTVIDVMAGKAEDHKDAADVNADGTPDVADISTIIDIMAGKGEAQSYTVCPDDRHPHWIDLGLPSGTKWACCNVGAVVPEDCGDYFTFEEAQVCNPPSLDQIKELLDNTTNEGTTQNGVTGEKFTGNNGGSVFLPAAGFVWSGELYGVGMYGNYWSSTPRDKGYAYDLYFDSGGAEWYGSSRGDGQSVRPVR